jgi:hypothetical protein
MPIPITVRNCNTLAWNFGMEGLSALNFLWYSLYIEGSSLHCLFFESRQPLSSCWNSHRKGKIMCLFNFVFKQTLNKRNYFSLVSPLLHTGILITSLTNKRNMKFNSKTRALIKHKPFQNPKNGPNMLRVGKSYDFHTKLLIFNVLTHTKILKSCLIIIVV